MEKFIVSARKYRPATFADVVGQPSIATTLKNSILNNHLGHAYLFSGPRGVGKTTCARIFAKTINCTHITDSGEACNECESCISFIENRSYNIHELDAASNNSVDDIRTLTEQVRIPPQIGSHSVYIIDEVHMLSQSAFNAFLKTLEEPPAHAVFVLATTEKHKIIPTILSRCQIFDFNRIRVEDAVEYLKQIAEKEDIEFEEDALHIIARKSDGSMRDALSIFDQVVSFSGQRITYKHVIENLHILDYEYYFRLTEMLLEGDISSALLLFNEVLLKGFDARNFMVGYATHLRDLMVCKDPDTIQLMEVGAGIRERYLSQSGNVPVSFLYDALDISNQADIQFRTSRNQRLTIELALVKLSGLGQHQKKKEITSEPDSGPTLSETESGEKSDLLHGPAGDKSGPDTHGDMQKSPGRSVSEGTNVVSRKSSISIKDTLLGPSGKQRIPEDSSGGTPEEGSDTQPETELPEPDLILNAWKSFAQSVEKSRPRIYSTLVNNKPVIKADGTVQVMLNSEGQQENFIKNIKPELIGYIRKHTGLKNVEIETGLSVAETNGKRIYTEQDKLDYLMKKNPDLGKLKTRFSLDFDD